VQITAKAVTVTTFAGEPAEVRPYHVDWDLSAAEKGGYDWFMRKEIYEQPKAVADTLLGRHDASGRLTLDEIRISEAELRSVDKIVVVACGTAFYSGLVASTPSSTGPRSVRGRAGQRVPLPRPDPVRRPPGGARSASPARPMDTLMAIRHAREQRPGCWPICNTNGSTIPRESDAVDLTTPAPRSASASTKAS
jgi:glucosamine--fructose-6-phosphate aminotransferase (isomerizing)